MQKNVFNFTFIISIKGHNEIAGKFASYKPKYIKNFQKKICCYNRLQCLHNLNFHQYQQNGIYQMPIFNYLVPTETLFIPGVTVSILSQI